MYMYNTHVFKIRFTIKTNDFEIKYNFSFLMYIFSK